MFMVMIIPPTLNWLEKFPWIVAPGSLKTLPVRVPPPETFVLEPAARPRLPWKSVPELDALNVVGPVTNSVRFKPAGPAEPRLTSENAANALEAQRPPHAATRTAAARAQR